MSKECCSTDDNPSKIKQNSPVAEHGNENHDHDPDHGHEHDHSHDTEGKTTFQLFLPSVISFVLLMTGLALDYWLKPDWFTG